MEREMEDTKNLIKDPHRVQPDTLTHMHKTVLIHSHVLYVRTLKEKRAQKSFRFSHLEMGVCRFTECRDADKTHFMSVYVLYFSD